MVTGLDERGHAFEHDHDVGDFVALAVEVLADLGELGAEVLAHYGEELCVLHAVEEAMLVEGIFVHSDSDADFELRWELFYEVA